ncbi:MAG: Gfo/Idh/MocA family oxidoreductase [Planctomycetes bacterium]|nr:Gfo/Idh/MocA family oxidoreductase [Planctomycetota bacterium]
MAKKTAAPCVTVVGGGMITKIQLLPTIYHLQREGLLGDIHICALNAGPLAELQKDPTLVKGFSGQSFAPHPDPARVDLKAMFPDLYKEVLAAAPKGSIAVVAVPDQFHYEPVSAALDAGLHVCVVKPLTLKHAQAEEIGRKAREKGLVVGVEYHKRFDYRSVMARKGYRAGRFGQFRLGQAHLHECWYYRHSNFQNWMTCENSDSFTYIGCHYVDLVAFITGLKPAAVSVYGLREKFPNGREGFLWTDARVIWENGACLSVANALGYPDAAAGGNSQSITMWCAGEKDGTLIAHSDQYRGVKHSYTAPSGDPGDAQYMEPNPDYFQMLDLGDGGLTPVGYGHRSVEYILKRCLQAGAVSGLAERRTLLKRFDDDGLMATPLNSSYNELVIEAGRKSILNGGREVVIDYKKGSVDFRQI